MDKTSLALVAGFPEEVSTTWAVPAKYANFPLLSLHHHANGRESIQEKARRQQLINRRSVHRIQTRSCWPDTQHGGLLCDERHSLCRHHAWWNAHQDCGECSRSTIPRTGRQARCFVFGRFSLESAGGGGQDLSLSLLRWHGHDQWGTSKH